MHKLDRPTDNKVLEFVRRGLMTIGLLCALGLPSFAQPKQAPPVNDKIPLEATFKVLAAQPASGKIVQGAPYSATATTETVQTLSDGNQIIRRNETKLYRDSAGRTRTEQTLATIGKWANQEAQQIITINDPVAGVGYSLNPRTRTAHRTTTPLSKPTIPTWNGSFSVNGKQLTQAEFEALMEQKRAGQEALPGGVVRQAKPPLSPDEIRQQKMAAANAPGAKHAYTNGKEPLGKQMIEGIEAEGVRVTITIPAGEIGNTNPIEIVEENWYSPVLQIVVLRKNRDPRSGETTYRLTNINRNEPERALFEVPADYTVSTNKALPKPKPKEEE